MQWWIWILVAAFLGLCIGALISWLVASMRAQLAQEQLKVQIATLEAEKKAEADKVLWTEQEQAHLSNTFQALAGQALQANSQDFLSRAGLVLEPLKENLTALDGHVRELEQKREGAYEGLSEQLRGLALTHADLQKTTTTLGQALRSPTVRGQWGEIQLRRVVEMAGMSKHIDFAEQASVDAGRPDMVIHLPERGVVYVDAKVPLQAYLAAVEAPDELTRAARYQEHARALRDRVRDLGKKKYWEGSQNSPELVVMFVPNEACLCAAFECDPTLLEKAIEQRVLITTPVTLLALLKSVAYGWQQQQIAANARHLFEEGKELYKRLDVYVQHLAAVGQNLRKTVEAHNKAVGSLETRILPFARHFHEVGGASGEIAPPDHIETQPRLPAAVESGPA